MSEQRNPVDPADEPIDESDTDEAEREFVNFAEPEKELRGDDDDDEDEQDGAA